MLTNPEFDWPKFATQPFRDTLAKAEQGAHRLRDSILTTHHLLYGLVSTEVGLPLVWMGVTPERIIETYYLKPESKKPYQGLITGSPGCIKMIRKAIEYATTNSRLVWATDLAQALSETDSALCWIVLDECGITLKDLQQSDMLERMRQIEASLL